MKRTLLLILVLSTVLLLGCTALTPAVTDSERESLAEKMKERGLAADPVEFDIVYAADETPRFIFCVSGNGYMIYDRAKKIVAETSTGNPFADYPTQKKYYPNVFTYCVYDETSPDAPYLNVATGVHGASLKDIPNWKVDGN